MLNGLRDYLWDIEGPANIDYLIKDYFKENGYNFEESGDEDYEEDDWDEDWDDDNNDGADDDDGE